MNTLHYFKSSLSFVFHRFIPTIVEEPGTPPNSAAVKAKPSSSKKVRKYRPRYWYVENTKAQKTKHGVGKTRRTENCKHVFSQFKNKSTFEKLE